MNKDGNIELGDLLTTSEAADLIRCKPSTLRAWFTQGRLPRTKIGRLTRVLRQDLEDFIRAGRSKTKNGKPEEPTDEQPI